MNIANISKKLSFIAIFISLSTLIVNIVIGIFIIIRGDAYLGAGEEYVTIAIHRLNLGFNLYEDPLEVPYSIIQYTPLYYYITFFIFKITNITNYSYEQIVSITRLISYTFYNLNIIVIFVICKRYLKLSSLFILFILSYLYATTSFFQILGRPDALMNFFLFTTVLVLFKYLKDKELECNIYILILLSVLSALSFLAKQNGIQIFFIVCIFLFIIRSYKILILFSILNSILILISIFIIFEYDSFYIKENVFDGVRNGINILGLYKNVVIPLYINNSIIFVLSLVLLIYYYINYKYINNKEKFLFVSILFTFVFCLITGLKIGSWWNYYFEYIIFSLIGIFYYINKEIDKSDLKYKDWINITIYIFVIIFLSINTLERIYMHRSLINYEVNIKDKYIKEYVKIINLKDDQYILSFDTKINFLIPNNSLFQQSLLNELSSFNRFKYKNKFEKMINDGKIKYLILKKSEINKKYLDIKYDDFIYDENLGDYSIYKYNKN